MLADYKDNQRKFSRFRLNTSVLCQCKGDKRSEYSLSRNVSEGGLCLDMGRFVPRGAELKLEFLLKRYADPIKAVARVAWIKKLPYAERYEAGLEFSDIDQSYKINLAQFLNSGALIAA